MRAPSAPGAGRVPARSRTIPGGCGEVGCGSLRGAWRWAWGPAPAPARVNAQLYIKLFLISCSKASFPKPQAAG